MKQNTRNLTIILIGISILQLISCKTLKAEVYQWKDEKGRIHFDNNGANAKRKDFTSNNKIQSVSWESQKVTFHKSIKQTNKQQKLHQKDLMKKCVKTKKRMKKISSSLKRPLIAEKFDAFQAELRDLRWIKRKVC